MWLLLAWTGAKTTECTDLPELPAVAGCMSAIAGGDLSGTVTEIGEGPFPAACSNLLGADPGTGWWVTVEDADGNTGTVGLAIPGNSSPLALGDTAHLIGAYSPADFGPTIGNVEVRDALDALIGWVGVGGRVSEVVPPLGMVLSQGDQVCETTEECGSWAASDLILEAEGHRQIVSYGQSTTVGNWTAWHAGNRQALTSDGCPDWYVSELRMGITR